MTRMLVRLLSLLALLSAAPAAGYVEYEGLKVKGVQTIDGKTVGNTTIYADVDSTSVVYLVIYQASPTGVTTPPTVSVGTNATTYDNIIAAGALQTSATPTEVRTPLVGYPLIAAGTSVVVRVSVAAVATTFPFDVYVLQLSY